MTVRVGTPGYALVEKLMHETSNDRATVLRAMFAIAGKYEKEVRARLEAQL